MATWKKGALHTHSSWSDGRAIPEVVLTNYKKLGYDFVSITDHNLFQEDPNVWQWISYEGSMFGMGFTVDAYEWTKEMLGENAEPVVAIPEDGYTFEGWDDGYKKPTRNDKEIDHPLVLVAIFLPIEDEGDDQGDEGPPDENGDQPGEQEGEGDQEGEAQQATEGAQVEDGKEATQGTQPS